MNIVEYYNELCKKKCLEEDKEIKEFNDNLNRNLERVRNLKFHRSIFQKIAHPLTTVKTAIEYAALTWIRRDFDEYLDSDLLQYLDEESGDFYKDLINVSEDYKPKYVRDYIKKYNYPFKK